jgi:hypothetical protein
MIVIIAPIAGVVGLAIGFALCERGRFRRRVRRAARNMERGNE